MLKNGSYTEETLFAKLRRDNKMSQRVFAEKLGISLVAYFHLEKGNTFPNFEVIDRCMEAFDGLNFEAFRAYYRRRKSFVETNLTR